MEKLKVGICGWGNVATGLFNALENNADIIASNASAQFTVSVIGAVSYTHLTLPTKA